MRTVIFGANGATGRLLVRQALDAGHDVVAVTRRPAELPIEHARLTVAEGDVVERTPVAARQLASRARRRLQGSGSVTDADLPTQRRVVDAFLAASRRGDFEALLAVLDPQVVFRVDAGARAGVAPALLTGRADVARHAAAQGPRFATLCEPALVNGAVGVIAKGRTGILAVVGITVVAERITELDLVLDPVKLTGLTIDP